MTDWQWLFFPGRITGLIGPRARREVNNWTKRNPTLRSLRYGLFRRFLLWSANHPLIFVLVIGTFSAGVAYIISGQNWDIGLKLNNPVLDKNFDIAQYTGVPWSIQATIVALVYPIVLSFIALMLQRKAHSTAALRIYVLDSAVIPAGASSTGLLIALGAQYFSAPYVTSHFLANYMTILLLFNSTWLACNLVLTWFFLSRTVRFIQEDEQRHAYIRIAIDYVLRAELISAVKQHIFVQAPYIDWGYPSKTENLDSMPLVRTIDTGHSNPIVKRDLKGSMVLHDIHLHLLKYVAWSWCRRAKLHHKLDKSKPPILFFPPMVGQIATGEVVLCSLVNGPSLTFFERALVRFAFSYRPSRQGKLSLTTKELLEEIGSEVEAAAEQNRFGAAGDALRNMFELHMTLLLASAVEGKGSAENAAIINTSPYAWGESSFDIEWLEPYREIGRIAVNHLDEDLRLFRILALIPTRIALKLPPKPEKLVIDAMRVSLNLVYQLSGWWTRKADASLPPGATSFSGTLPAPLSKVYEQALTSFVGSWGGIFIQLQKNDNASSEDVWSALTARALIYAKHIDNSAEMFLKAVSRGDEAASSWLLDNFIKWWGNRQHELEYGDLDEFQVRHVTLSLAEKSWFEAASFLKGTEPDVTIEMAGKALSLAIHRYWESMRFYIVLLLIRNADLAAAAHDCREMRLAAALIKGMPQNRGGKVECKTLDNDSDVTTTLLDVLFGVETVVDRLDKFAEKLDMDNEAPEVSGWIYGWSGNLTNLQSMKREIATLLVALKLGSGRRIHHYNKLILRWWMDLDKLKSVEDFSKTIRREVLSQDFNAASPGIFALQSHLGNTGSLRSRKLAVSNMMKDLHTEAFQERISTLKAANVDEKKVRAFAEEISNKLFDPQHWSSLPFATVEFVQGLATPKESMLYEDYKEQFISHIFQKRENVNAEVTEYVRQRLLYRAFSKLVAEANLSPVNSPSLRNNYNAPTLDIQNFISSVGALCTSLRSAGADPIVLVGRAAGIGAYFNSNRWGPKAWQHPPPTGVTLRNFDPSIDKPAKAFINDTPVYEFETSNGDCYVVPSSMVKTLEVAGFNKSSAINIRWTQLNEEKLNIEINWVAHFR